MFIKTTKRIEDGVHVIDAGRVISRPKAEAQALIARGAALTVERRYNFKLDAVDLLNEVTDGSQENASAS